VAFFSLQAKNKKMRACFLGQNVCALGFGVATLQTPPLIHEPNAPEPDSQTGFAMDMTPPRAGHDISTREMTGPPSASMAEKPLHWPDPARIFPV
jgi:hypothetical protein